MTKQTWVLDPTHSELQFKIKHLMLSNVTGQFNDFRTTIESAGDDFTDAKINFQATVNSIFTNNEQRDAHLRNGDFFDADKFPLIVFESEKMEKVDSDEYKVTGNITIKGITRRITLQAEFGGVTKDPWGNTRTGFTVSGKLNRFDFGMSFGSVSEAGGLLLGEEVKINANVQFVKEAMAYAA
jgi:polyisoprenoid-binding protein YceI